MNNKSKELLDKNEEKKINVTKQLGSLKPASNSPASKNPFHALQNKLGNKCVQRLLNAGQIQAKLKTGIVADKYEREADQIASKVMRIPESQTKRGFITKNLENNMFQTRKMHNSSTEKQNTHEAKLNFSGQGKPMPEIERKFFESRFKYDFSKVRIHDNEESNKISRVLNAKAFARGRDIWFRKGAYKPESFYGRKLLSHELAHVVQQSKNKASDNFFDHNYNSKRIITDHLSSDEFTPAIGEYIQKFDEDLEGWGSEILGDDRSALTIRLRFKLFDDQGRTLQNEIFSSNRQVISSENLVPGRTYRAMIIGGLYLYQTRVGPDHTMYYTYRMEYEIPVDNRGIISVNPTTTRPEFNSVEGDVPWSFNNIIFIQANANPANINHEITLERTEQVNITNSITVGSSANVGVEIPPVSLGGGPSFEYSHGNEMTAPIPGTRMVNLHVRLNARQPHIHGDVEVGDIEIITAERILCVIQNFNEGSFFIPTRKRDEVADWFGALPENIKRRIRLGEIEVKCIGHASTTEGAARNYQISNQRAVQVYNILLQTIDSNRTNLSHRGMGEEEAVCQGANCPEERRVDILVIVPGEELDALNASPNQGRRVIDIGAVPNR